EIVLQATAACSAMDVMNILTKRRKHIESLEISLEAERAADHPQIFTAICMHFEVVSCDVTIRELEAAIELSLTKYCSVSTMLQRGGVTISWNSTVIRSTASDLVPDTIVEEPVNY